MGSKTYNHKSTIQKNNIEIYLMDVINTYTKLYIYKQNHAYSSGSYLSA